MLYTIIVSVLCISLKLPSLFLTINFFASIGIFIFLFLPLGPNTSINQPDYPVENPPSSAETKTVAGIFCGSVVHNINKVCAGGSSRSFSNALKASLVNICTSSITNTFIASLLGNRYDLSLITRTSSIPRLEAPSISITSILLPLKISLQLAHLPHGSIPTGFKQLTALANILAAEVLPDPLGPANKNDCCPSLLDRIKLKALDTSGKSNSDTLTGRCFK